MTGRLARLTLVGAISAAGVAVSGMPATHAQDESPLQVVLTQVSPLIPDAGDTVEIDAYATNNGDEPLNEVSVDLRVTNVPFDARWRLRNFAAGRSEPRTLHIEGATAEIGSVAPGELAPFRLQASIDAFDLHDQGVYGLEVSAAAGRDEAAVRTFLTWMPDADQISPIQIAWLWPLAERPVRDESDTFTTDDLAGSLAEGGRLDGLVTAAAGRPVTWVVDPDLLDTAAAMADGYRLTNGADGGGRETAARWLDELRGAIGEQEVLMLPYADVDAPGLIRAGRSGELDRAIREGVAATEEHLGRQAESGIAWPSAGFADMATLSALDGAGYSGVILDDAAVPVADDLIYTPTGRADLAAEDGVIASLLSDGTIAESLSQDTLQPGAGPLAVQRVMAETALIALEQPNRRRAILVEPPRRWNPDPAVASQLLSAYAEAPWIQPITVTDLAAIEPPSNITRRAPVVPDTVKQAELPTSYLDAVARLSDRVDQFADILSDGDPLITSYAAALLRAQSSAWADGRGGVRDEGVEYLQALERDLDSQVDQVRIISRGTVTLSSNSGTIPVTVANDLDQPVRVQLALTPRVGSRLSIGQVQPFIVDARARHTVEVQASAVANGITTIDARLLTLDGEPLGDITQFKVRATNFGRVGFWIVGGAMALLFVSAGIRIARRVVTGNRRRPAHADKPPTDERVKV